MTGPIQYSAVSSGEGLTKWQLMRREEESRSMRCSKCGQDYRIHMMGEKGLLCPK
jgi:hypothetical protein